MKRNFHQLMLAAGLFLLSIFFFAGVKNLSVEAATLQAATNVRWDSAHPGTVLYNDPNTQSHWTKVQLYFNGTDGDHERGDNTTSYSEQDYDLKE